MGLEATAPTSSTRAIGDPQVGYYGGVSYGFGYNGNGYEGGEWRSGHFFYNRSVNNVTNVRITNVYEKTVVVNQVSRASFNGPGGATAKPTPQQLAVAQQRHVQPTAAQTQHARAAAAQPDLRASANHGAPPVAATGKPADFAGAGVVKASAPGGDYHPPAAVEARQAQARAAHGVAAAPAARPETAAAATGPEEPKVAASAVANDGGPKPRNAAEQGRPAKPAQASASVAAKGRSLRGACRSAQTAEAEQRGDDKQQ